MRFAHDGMLKGITVGRRSNGFVAILWDDNEIKWYSPSEVADLLV
jgi:hypothetical protein